MSDLGLVYCPAADPDLDTGKAKLTTYNITQRTAEDIYARFNASGIKCTMEEVQLIKKWMNTDPYETIEGQFGEHTNKLLQMTEENQIEGFECLRAWMKKKVKVKFINADENEFSFIDSTGKEVVFRMPTEFGHEVEKAMYGGKNILDGIKLIWGE